jgi:hypothetical protein
MKEEHHMGEENQTGGRNRRNNIPSIWRSTIWIPIGYEGGIDN